MKKTTFFTALIALLLTAGCSTTTTTTTTTLSTPEPHPEKYALQVISIEVPLPDTYDSLSSYAAVSDDVDTLLKNPQAVITEFPIVYAAVGETGMNDRNGNRHITFDEETTELGYAVEFTVKEVENQAVEVCIIAKKTELGGMQKREGKEPRPLFKRTGLDTEILLNTGVWVLMGGAISEKTDTAKSKRTKRVTAIQILPPADTL